MIIYQSIKQNFLNDILSNEIETIIHRNYTIKTGRHVAASEIRSWKESLRYMGAVLNDAAIPGDAGISIEYHIPQTSKRIDFLLTGQGEDGTDHAILIELKQWDHAELTTKDGLVKTRFQHGNTETSHPSYQVWSYASLLTGFNEAVYMGSIQLQPCAYLHNYTESESDPVITNAFYGEYLAKAPVYLKGESEREKLQSFIKRFVKHGDKNQVMLLIENGRIRPSKTLAESLEKMLKGNEEFVMIDDQKVVYETALSLARESTTDQRNVLIVQGGPGTGKSVVAINLLVALTRAGMVTQYVTKNAAPRAVYERLLTGSYRKSEISNFFTGSGAFTATDHGAFDALIVDEAHRLNAKSGMYKNLGENQIKEIIHSSKFSIFFIDEDQRVTWSDIGEESEILRWASACNAKVSLVKLESQFRCNGSDGYIAWLDQLLQIRETANTSLDTGEYDFRVMDSPAELRDLIFEKNKEKNKARLVAGYCWNWVSKKDPSAMDIEFPEFGFGMQWNLAAESNLWIMGEKSVAQVGCIHTCQGLEVDYIGVIIGPDLVIRNGEIVTNPKLRARTDTSLNGYGKDSKLYPDKATQKADAIIKNTYRTLMTRGLKGCYVYSTDAETAQTIKNLLEQPSQDIEYSRAAQTFSKAAEPLDFEEE